MSRALILSAVAAMLVACGGGGDSNGNNGSGPPAAYTVGGTVSGLSGTGLVLRNNGGDDLTVNASGTFNFATLVNSGAAYNVSVQTQPSSQPSQTCVVTNGSGNVGAGAVTTISVNCRAPVGKYLYVPHLADGSVSGYSINPSNGALTPLQGSPFSGPIGVPALGFAKPVLSPNGQFLYLVGTVGSNTGPTLSTAAVIVGYRVDNTTGQLIALQGFPIQLNASGDVQFVFHPAGNIAYLRVGLSFAAQLYGFTIDSTTGALTLVPGPPLINGFAVDPMNGAQTLIPGSPLVTRFNSEFALSNDGKYLFLNKQVPFNGTINYAICTYIVNATDGSLSLRASNPPPGSGGNFAVAVDPSGKFLLASSIFISITNNVIVYSIADATGQLNLAGWATSGTSIGQVPRQFLFNRNGSVVYAVNSAPHLAGNVAAFLFNSEPSLVLNFLPGSPPPTPTGGNMTSQAVLDATGKYLAVTNLSSGTIAVFTVSPASGALIPVNGSPISPAVGTSPGEVIFDPSGLYLYLTDRDTSSISSYAINSSTDALTFVRSEAIGSTPGLTPLVVGLQ